MWNVGSGMMCETSKNSEPNETSEPRVKLAQVTLVSQVSLLKSAKVERW